MWLITNFGFFSIVRKPDDAGGQTLTVRSRAKDDLVALRERYLPHLGPIQEDAGTDYRYRARAHQSDLAIALLQIALDIDYANFKSSVAQRQGSARAHLYHQVWDVLFQLQESEPPVAPDAPARPARQASPGVPANVSYGGVLFDERGRVLLRKPRGEFDNYVWTFAKGRGEPGLSAEQTALREVMEETGYRAEIIGRVPGRFQGGTGTNEYFIMRPVSERQPFDPAETEAIEWVSRAEAADYINQTRNPVGRERDLAVLLAAVTEYERVSGGGSGRGSRS